MARAQTVVIQFGTGEVCFSYGVPVAAFVPGHGFVRTAQKFSRTSSRHANRYAGKDSDILPAEEFDRLIKALMGGRLDAGREEAP